MVVPGKYRAHTMFRLDQLRDQPLALTHERSIVGHHTVEGSRRGTDGEKWIPVPLLLLAIGERAYNVGPARHLLYTLSGIFIPPTLTFLAIFRRLERAQLAAPVRHCRAGEQLPALDQFTVIPIVPWCDRRCVDTDELRHAGLGEKVRHHL